MEKKMNKFGVEKLLAVLAVAFACVSMWGCGFEDGTHKEWMYRDAKKVVGFLDDSLVIVGDVRRWREVSDEDGDVVGLGAWGHQALYLFNYRVRENGPRWMDSLDNGFESDFEYFRGQLSDSIIWGGGGSNYIDFQENISFWKIGQKPKKIKISRVFDGCSHKVFAEKMHEWYDGKIVVFGGTSVIDSLDPYRYIKNALVTYDSNKAYCQYGILDTIAQTITYKRLDKDLEWIKKCDDVRVWKKDVYCFVSGEYDFGAVLLRNTKDTIDIPLKFTIGAFWGDVLRINANLCNLIDDKVVCSGVIWRGGLMFYQNDEVIVNLE